MRDLTELAGGIRDAARDAESRLEEANRTGRLSELLGAWWSLKLAYDDLDDARKAVYKLIDRYDKGVIPERMESEAVDSVRIPELGRSFYTQVRYTARMLDPGAAKEWLRENGAQDLITETVNAGTLAAYLKSRLLEEGVEPPADILALNSYQTVGSAKYQPKT